MTSVKIYKSGGDIIKLEAQGHAGYGVYGEDVVCAGISSIIQTAMLGLMQVVQINAEIKRDEEANLMVISLPSNIPEDKFHEAQIVLKTMFCGLADLREGFSDFIELEVIDNV